MVSDRPEAGQPARRKYARPVLIWSLLGGALLAALVVAGVLARQVTAEIDRSRRALRRLGGVETEVLWLRRRTAVLRAWPSRPTGRV